MVVDVGVVKNHIKPKADSTLHNTKKADLIEYIRTLEHNYNVAVSFNENQAKYIESLNPESLRPQWVSIYDKLPATGERVLATDGAYVGEMYINSRGKWQRYNVNDSALMMALDILWWRPMPQPPKMEGAGT